MKLEDTLIRDFTDAVKKGDLSSFFVAHPEMARMGWRCEEAERSRMRREQASDEQRAAARASSAASKKRQRSVMSDQERADFNAKNAARMREKRQAEKRSLEK